MLAVISLFNAGESIFGHKGTILSAKFGVPLYVWILTLTCLLEILFIWGATIIINRTQEIIISSRSSLILRKGMTMIDLD